MLKLLPFPKRRVRTPTLIQIETVECGAIALGIILAYHGCIVPLPELRIRCGVSRDGSTAANLVKAALQLGLKAKGFRKQVEQLRELQPPFIAYWNFNHFLVVEGFQGDRIWLNDPERGRYYLNLKEFTQHYSGVVLTFTPTEKFQKRGQRWSTIRALGQRLRGSGRDLLFCILANLLLVIPGMAIAVFAQVFVDQVLIQNQTSLIRPLVVGMLVVTLVQTSLLSLQLQKLRYLQLRLVLRMSSEFVWHVLCLPVEFYAQRFAGEISSRINLNSDIAKLLCGTLARSVIDGAIACAYVLLMWLYDPVLTVLSTSSVLINLGVLRWIAQQRTDVYSRLEQFTGKIAGVEISGLQNIETLKAAALESDFFARWAGHYAKTISLQQAMLKGDLALGTLPIFWSTFTSMVLLVLGGMRVIDGHLTIGMLIAIQGLTNRFQAPVSQLMGLGDQIQSLSGGLKRLDDVLQNPIDPWLQTDQAKNLDIQAWTSGRLTGSIELRNVTFGYSPVREPLIKNFSCRLEVGQRLALVGGSGSGKSTLAKLIAGLYQPWGGEILLDGVPRSQIPRAVLTDSLALVEQDIFLFEGTIRDNLTLWDDSIGDRPLLQACEDAEILETVMQMGGLNAELLEGGANLSGGQRQRLEIARALSNNPTLLILDEASSSLDAATEHRINCHLRRRGCTCIIIAHRLSTIRNCDEIIVLEQGQVAERGTHTQLLQANGAYTALLRHS